MVELMATMEPEVAETFVSNWDLAVAEGRAEGLTRGRAEGRTEGQADLLSWQLGLRFGDLDDEVRAAVRAASADQIAAWSALLIEGTLTLEDVTG